MSAAEAKAEAERVAKNAKIQEAIDAKADAAVAAAKDTEAAVPSTHVRVRITKAGHGKVHTGGPPRRQHREDVEVYDGENLAPTFDKGDVVMLERKIAEALEARHFVEIEE